ncbi:MAG: phospholipid carrier-dependent glycosyltransferase [gamma proteobacterium symbiont of Bathyaustriella thionipta]|nr:phospholipid carrier-dependent glycosyltransferase [gamma proteobacterium symbiont of Bathyaustriella thionipta]MCU7949760.1 phospholipid carrier-dependent glycosyltransferase [gamma proteobacterium symbiont of Bathyaustriella thionipta]MCU7953001.1 phospholipid carrier-dependent glycosyltransferase [gamma proteobacterium symbiont of Bathyaustriella thionipta]MCU7956357.1 phospholipid carrier-dependent glycosyltransferase [gamma proteobacterium symbiont of Bathyaustriella thionipta]
MNKTLTKNIEHDAENYIDFITWQKSLYILSTLFLIVYILPLGVRPLFTPDEVRYGGIAREMLVSGDWIVPHFLGFRYFEKPPMGYWMNALSLLAFGDTAFGVRFSSAISTGMTAFAIFFLTLKTCRRVYPALLSSLIYLTFLQVFIIGTLGVLDAILTAWLSLAMVAFFLGEIEIVSKKKAYIYLGLFCGLAFLTKGFLALAVPVIVICPYMLWQRRFLELIRYSWLPILTALLIVLPWALMIHFNEGDFWRYFFWEEHINRFFSNNAHHVEPFWYFIPVLLIFSLPWTTLFPLAFAKSITFYKKNDKKIDTKKHNNEVKLFGYLLLWFFIPFLFFSVSKGKLASYILPCYFPLSILLALGLEQTYGLKHVIQRKWTNYIEKMGAYMNIFIALGLISGIIFVQWFSDKNPVYFLTDSMPVAKSLILIFSLFIWGGLSFFFISKKIMTSPWKPYVIVIMPIVLMLAIPFAIPDRMRIAKAPGHFMLNQKNLILPDTIIISEHALMGAVGWFLQRNDVYLTGGQGEFKYGLKYSDSKSRHIPYTQLTSFIDKNRKQHPIMFFDKSSSSTTPDYVPKPNKTIRENKFILRIYHQNVVH